MKSRQSPGPSLLLLPSPHPFQVWEPARQRPVRASPEWHPHPSAVGSPLPLRAPVPSRHHPTLHPGWRGALGQDKNVAGLEHPGRAAGSRAQRERLCSGDAAGRVGGTLGKGHRVPPASQEPLLPLRGPGGRMEAGSAAGPAAEAPRSPRRCPGSGSGCRRLRLRARRERSPRSPRRLRQPRAHARRHAHTHTDTRTQTPVTKPREPLCRHRLRAQPRVPGNRDPPRRGQTQPADTLGAR